jgi:hypothetical protein
MSIPFPLTQRPNWFARHAAGPGAGGLRSVCRPPVPAGGFS